MEKLVNKAQASIEVWIGAGTSAGLVSTPLWVTGLTDALQILTLLVGIAVGISAYRLNEARREQLEDEDE